MLRLVSCGVESGRSADAACSHLVPVKSAVQEQTNPRVPAIGKQVPPFRHG